MSGSGKKVDDGKDTLQSKDALPKRLSEKISGGVVSGVAGVERGKVGDVVVVGAEGGGERAVLANSEVYPMLAGESIEKYQDKLRETNPVDLRSKHFVLTEEGNNLLDSSKKEFEARMASYLKDPDVDGFREACLHCVLYTHEFDVGLGEIVPLEIQEVVVIDRKGERFEGERTVIKGRVCFKNKATGKYLPIFSGDRVKFIRDENITDEQRVAQIREDVGVRSGYLEFYSNDNVLDVDLSISDKHIFELAGKNDENVEELGAKIVDDLMKVEAPTLALEPKKFISKYLPLARFISAKYKIPVSLCLAQTALETGWGGSALARNGNSFFAITLGGESVGFMRYRNAFESFEHYGALLGTRRRYQNLFEERGLKENYRDYKGWAKAVMDAGYAGDQYKKRAEALASGKSKTLYADKLVAIIEQYGLNEYELP